MNKPCFSPEVQENERIAHNGFCRIEDCLEIIHKYYHRLPNTKTNQEKFPLFLQSQFNCAGLCYYHGLNIEGVRISESEAQVYEEYLRRLTGRKRK